MAPTVKRRGRRPIAAVAVADGCHGYSNRHIKRRGRFRNKRPSPEAPPVGEPRRGLNGELLVG
jgi:hypothetical protein